MAAADEDEFTEAVKDEARRIARRDLTRLLRRVQRELKELHDRDDEAD